jgi:hypothetical protein
MSMSRRLVRLVADAAQAAKVRAGGGQKRTHARAAPLPCQRCRA